MKEPALDGDALEVLKPILDALPFYVLLVDEEHRIITSNRAVQRELDKLPADLEGCHCPEAIHGEKKAYAGCTLEEAVEQGGVAVEKEFFDKETGRWMESMIYPVDVAEDKAQLYVHFVRDISESKRMREIAISRERLARVGEFSARLAHNIRNPLHGLLNSVAHLQTRFGGEDSETAEILTWMTEGLSRLERVTRRMLTLTRETPIEKRSLSLNKIVRDAVSLVSERVRDRGPELEMDLKPLPHVGLDPDRLGEVVVNLLDNAMDACGDGGAVDVRTYAHTGRGEGGLRGQCLEVQDSGAGIPAELLDKVFDPFFTTKPVGEGSGLGLAIARRVITEHAGEVEVQSEEGKGTLIRVVLPE